MLTMRGWILGLAAIAMASTATDGRAQSKQAPGADTLYQNQGTRLEKSNKVWSGNDDCGKESFRKFPDYTTDAALKRDAYMRDCLRKHHLPPRNDLARPLKP